MKTQLVLFALIFGFFTKTHAQVPLEQRAEFSELIVEGKVVHQEGKYNFNKTRIYTLSTIEVSKIIKGDARKSQINILTEGGQIGETGYKGFHSESLSLNQEGIFFLRKPTPELKKEVQELTNHSYYLTGKNYAIKYSDDLSYPAFDFNQVYPSVDRILQNLASYTKTEIINLAPNSWEQKSKQNEAAFSQSSGLSIIEYRFENIVLDYPNLNIDVTVLSNLKDITYAGGEVYIQYNSELLGENLVANQEMRIKHAPLLNPGTYPINYFDADAQTAKANIKVQSQVDLFPLSPQERRLLKIQLDVTDLLSAGNISMNDFKMNAKSYYFEKGSKGVKVFDKIIVPTNTPLFTGGFTFSPPILNAGVGDVLTITANAQTNFGTAIGQVFLRDTDDPPPIELWTQIEDQHISWSEQEIKVVIPHNNEPVTGINGSGQIKVITATETIISEQSLEICYNVTNENQQGPAPDRIQDMSNENGQGGYTFFLGEDLDAIPNARENVQEAICYWNAYSGVNFVLSPDIIEDPIKANDGRNIIYLGTELTPPLPGQSEGTAETFQSTDGFDQYKWVKDIDIVLNENMSFHYYSGNSVPSASEFDFYSVIIHELGHGLSMHHAVFPDPTNKSKIMHPFLGKGEVRRNIDGGCGGPGAAFVIDHSQGLSNLPNGLPNPGLPMIEVTFNYCTTATDDLAEANFHIQASPNPFSNQLILQYEMPKSVDTQFEFFNLQGQLMYIEKGRSQAGSNQILFENLDLHRGVYIVQIKTPLGIDSFKIIKQ